jgi:hypothetical protein
VSELRNALSNKGLDNPPACLAICRRRASFDGWADIVQRGMDGAASSESLWVAEPG